MMDIASQLILRWHRFAAEEIDVCDNFTRLTFDTIALCGFDYRFNSFYRNEMHQFVVAMGSVLTEGNRRSQRLPLQNTLMVRAAKQYQDNIAYMHKLCDEIVQYRRMYPNDTNDLLNRMINGKDQETGLQLSDENIRYQMVTFLIAGHETTSGMLSLAFYYLLKNPHAFQKAQAEADQFDEITVDILPKLKYIDAILKETLRLQPIVSFFSVQSKADKEILPGGYEIHKDDRISVLVRQLHRDTKVWDRPEDFLPERMLNGGFENLPPNAWKPFGNGQRSCLGRPFAMQESVIVIALILKHFNLEFVDPSYDLRIKQMGTIKPAGFKIRARPRQQVKIPLGISIKKQEEMTPAQIPAVEANQFQPLSILFGSNSGSCESFARTLASEAPTHGFNATIATLDSVVGAIPCDRPVIIVTSSYEGQPCSNAKQFVAYLQSKPELKVNYAVFGAGHHDWVNTYQKIPIYIDETLEKVGGTRIVDRGIGDAAGDFFGAFEAWKDNLFQVLRKMNGLQGVISQEKLSIEIVNSTRSLGQITDVGIVIENRLLVEASELGPAKRHIEIELPKGQTYRAGDYLAVLPTNPPEIVRQILKRFKLSIDTNIKITSSTETFLPTGYPVSAYTILWGYVELSQPISRKQVETLAALCKDENEQTQLQSLGGDAYEKEILDKRLSILDILEQYPSCDLSFSQYLRMVPSLRVRQYSISSSPLWNFESVTLSIDVLTAPALSGLGQHWGVASNYLANLKPGDRLSCSVRASDSNFHLPTDTKVPVVMFAAGSGIAPFRGFIQERAAQMVCGRQVGPTILYYGCRSEKDFLYADEIDKWSKIGAIQVKHVFSRGSKDGKKYVQDLVWEDRKDIRKLFSEGARLYTCGSATKLAGSLKTCFIKIIAEHRQCDESEAATILATVDATRYSVDVFA
ncbi:unnamed protein product [Rotaria sordida]|uniref:Cytochrome P450 n=1 Tax=Rotaria sordida TaxID=392033 RepID=A0A814IXM4_9BILA|nr:unnamed protein product [Rotaria sordida]CAF1077757.1 unnamed protein product [Rotaria sordida]CAF1189303.1 unnamed protein product [Rotaria sordida]CAF3794867.1 unnamed protein product [Rotaria sordida]CAF3960108.1 unnamed protein product [Rotaria sordida]